MNGVLLINFMINERSDFIVNTCRLYISISRYFPAGIINDRLILDCSNFHEDSKMWQVILFMA